MNLPNKLTLLRIIMIPVFVVLLYLDFPFNNLVALAVFILASITDTLDGYIARKYNLITDFGKFMDPIADKLLVTAAMLVFVDWHMMPAWVVIVVVAREFIVSALRLVAANNGRVIAAGWSGKVKTASTMVCICIMLLGLPQWVNAVCSAVILVTTAYSGIEYLVKNKDVLDLSNI
ncbi:MAG: CDP-diacylglycerol--glycerol-3-phosphate 3-phosphatidyltransferase [Oscillospiraceae bacterium]|nr:CDP-diacylglycerol--glycerol-3-phosphate 3-phosphatidyltransferase [Eubacteriales bacterium]MDY2618772.1 CDP-diacylglycerol--glycerol-3-phosphate 3-phosphatidyltransferase [Oscillospiraceae bacterium]